MTLEAKKYIMKIFATYIKTNMFFNKITFVIDGIIIWSWIVPNQKMKQAV